MASLGVGYLQSTIRVRRLTQDVRQSLAGAQTAIEARDLTLAGQRVAEAQGRLGAEEASAPGLAAEVSRIRREIGARQADEARFQQFLKVASDAQDKMGMDKELGGERIAEEALGLYGVLAENDWSSRLESSYLTTDQKRQIREAAYVTLVSLADFGVRWPNKREDPRVRPAEPRLPAAGRVISRADASVLLRAERVLSPRGEHRRVRGGRKAVQGRRGPNRMGLLPARSHGGLERRPRRGHAILPFGALPPAGSLQLAVLPRHETGRAEDQP